GTSTPLNQIVYDCELAFQCRTPKWVWKAPNAGYRGFNPSDQYDTFRDPYDNPNASPRSTPTQLAVDGYELPAGSNLFILPDDAIGDSASLPSRCPRNYDDPGAFQIQDVVAMASYLTPLND